MHVVVVGQARPEKKGPRLVVAVTVIAASGALVAVHEDPWPASMSSCCLPDELVYSLVATQAVVVGQATSKRVVRGLAAASAGKGILVAVHDGPCPASSSPC